MCLSIFHAFDCPKMKQEHPNLPSLSLYREIVEGCADAIVVLKGDQTIRFLNKSAEAMFGQTLADMLGRPLGLLLPENFRENHYEQVNDFAKLPQESPVGRNAQAYGLRKSGEIFPADITILRTRDDDGTHLIAMVRDVTATRQLEDRLRALARTDSLTGILNRGAFEARAKDEVSRGFNFDQPLATVMIDIDHFKDINDCFGHAVGDDALKFFVSVVSGELRSCDVFGRWGGEEFALMLPSTTEGAAMTMAERIRLAIKESPFSTEQMGDPIHLTLSAGVTDLREGDTVDTLLDRADRALYSAKADGRDCVCQGAITPGSVRKLSGFNGSNGRDDRT